ncbi:MAG TPA: chemotaxis protein CheD [Candidatus Hydrogenedentes bacterium]|nr:chemotaxis protein CheD [Candidatus Hydrogenedentota bacterium]HOJ67684.1 chemotaxis protein CheD [Candidatus Hydrogenedentota bacterium]HOK89199.1 chemotaxis protein CheD [Candidatus Hydrogenedentota bacterium]HOV59608.1 chemotaxis protein CheD [Candidatus Hydrogenedentota bacterium]HPO31048.1 chemotaxis protein CheD [Candidatus Hydrogenedentota bacterium]
MQITVGISDLKISKSPQDILITYSLGSCIGVTMYDPDVPIGGLIHCMLPTSKIDEKRAESSPFMFTDVGIPEMLRVLYSLGAQKKRLIVKAAGAARLLDDENTFRIGERNEVVLRKILWKNNILLAASDTGGSIARTMLLEMRDGTTKIRSGGKEYVL